MDKVIVTSSEMHGTYGSFEIEIRVSVNPPIDWGNPSEYRELYSALRKARQAVEDAVQSHLVISNPEVQEKINNDRKEIADLFDEHAYIVAIPNGYAPDDPYFRYFPWFRITTRVGIFIVGWRKRVLVIDWNGTNCLKQAEELLPDYNVTKDGRMAHAWSIANARIYVDRVFEHADYPEKV